MWSSATYRFLLISLIICSILELSEGRNIKTEFLRRGQRPRCTTLNRCVQWCRQELEIFDRVPKCFQHRCWCITEDSPLNSPMSYFTTLQPIRIEESIVEGSGYLYNNSENPEQTPINFDLIDYVKNWFEF